MQSEIGLILGGGGGKGSYQIGVWRALNELGLTDSITGVSGASVGALNAALWGIGDYDLAVQIWSGIKPAEFLDLDYEQSEDGKRGVFSREGLIRIMNEKLDLQKVRDSSRLLYANGSRMVNDQLTAEYFTLNQRAPEEIQTILLASSAIPVVYEPVKIGGFWYQDGGLTDNLPIKPLYDFGFRRMIAVGLGREMSLPLEQFSGAEITKVHPQESIGGLFDGTLDFSAKETPRRMELGYQDAMRALKE